MYAIDCFTDLCTEIEIAETKIEGYKLQKKSIMKLLGAPNELQAMQYSDMPTAGINAMSIDRLIDTLQRIDNMLFIEEGLLKGMNATKTSINAKLKGLEGIPYKVMYKRHIENKTIIRIAQELNYSTRQVDRIINNMS